MIYDAPTKLPTPHAWGGSWFHPVASLPPCVEGQRDVLAMSNLTGHLTTEYQYGPA